MSYQFGHVDRDERIDLAATEPVGEAAPRRRIPTSVLSVAAMAVFAGGVYAAYIAGTHHAAVPSAAGDKVPLIRADEQPTKVRPDRPGGMEVPDRDKLIYSERPGGPPVERLLPPPEQPGPRPGPPVMPSTAGGPVATAPQAVSPPPAAAPLAAPAPAARSPAAPPPRREAAATPKPTPAATPHRAAAGHIRVQLGSVRSPEAARDEWQRLKKANPDLLGRLTADAVRADLGERGIYYRILAGSFDEAAASRLCRELKQRSLGCRIVR